MEETIKIYICEDDPVFARLLLDRLAKEPDMEALGVAYDKESLLAGLERTSFDVLLLDLNLASRSMEGLEIALDLHDRYPSRRIIVLSSMEEEDVVSHMLGLGRVVNYITKDYLEDIPEAIRSAYRNQSGIHHSAARKVLHRLTAHQELEIRKRITPKQIQILKLQDAGYSRREISEILFYSEYTINNELCKVSSILKGKFPYLEWLRLKKHNSKEILKLAKQLRII